MTLDDALRQRVLLLNTCTVGNAFRGEDEQLRVLNQPDRVFEWSRQLVEAGSDVLEADTCDADVLACEHYPVAAERLPEWNREAVRITRAAAKDEYVIGAIGEGLDLLTVQARHSFEEQSQQFAIRRGTCGVRAWPRFI
jgi:methionine synthase I (cobalamin-dependent)